MISARRAMFRASATRPLRRSTSATARVTVRPTTGTPVIGLTVTLAVALVLLLSGRVALALNIALLALIILYFLHSIALLCLPITNRELYRSVTLPMPRWLQIAAALLSIVSMGALIVLLMRDRETVILLAAWSAIGA